MVAQARSVWSIRSISSVWLSETNQINQTDEIDRIDQIDQMNKTGWRTVSASCSYSTLGIFSDELLDNRAFQGV